MALRNSLAALFAAQANAVWLAGVNIAGCDIGMDTSGNYQPDGQYGCPYSVGPSQMQHFANDDGFNVFRIPVAWQSLVGNDLVTNKLDRSFTNGYYGIVQACLDTGAHCMQVSPRICVVYCCKTSADRLPYSIDIHNYARWWNGIVGQGGAGSDTLAQTWSQIAADWAGQNRIIFGTMNEPHDLTDINVWADTLQQVVYAIRDAGATSQMIFLSGTNYANAFSFQYDSADALRQVKNRDGSTTNLIFELHQYFDGQGGKTTACTDALADKFRTLADYFRSIDRQAFIGELGGGNGQDCVDIICPVLDALNDNGDAFLGWTSWAAGDWWSDYELSEVPVNGQDVGIVRDCFAAKF